MKNRRVFLCYAREDFAPVHRVYHALKNAGFDPWLDKESLLPGQQWEQEIPSAIRASAFIIVFLSAASVAKRGYVQREFKLALDTAQEIPEGDIFLIPVKLDDCEVPQSFRRFQWSALNEPRGLENVLKGLAYQTDPMSTHHGVRSPYLFSGSAWDSMHRYRSIESRATILDHAARWRTTWKVTIVALADGVAGIRNTNRIENLRPGSYTESVEPEGIVLEQIPVAFPGSIGRFFRLPKTLEEGEAATITYYRAWETMTRPPGLFLAKPLRSCAELGISVRFEGWLPPKLWYREGDRADLITLRHDLVLDVREGQEVERTVIPDPNLSYGFDWVYHDP